jgi:hypothetical protein
VRITGSTSWYCCHGVIDEAVELRRTRGSDHVVSDGLLHTTIYKILHYPLTRFIPLFVFFNPALLESGYRDGEDLGLINGGARIILLFNYGARPLNN